MQGTLKVHSENILPIIKKWLYSEKEIFLRELVSNASDALFKRSALDQGKEPGRIDISIDRENKTITIADTGLGMDLEEVEKYIAQVAFSGAKEFAEQYAKEETDSQIIGHFGLGFFSAFMVASRVEIDTLSYKEGSSPVFWSSEGSSTYEIAEGKRSSIGTSVTLFLEEASCEYLEEKTLADLLKKHCSYLSYPIYLEDKLLSHTTPLFLRPAGECSEKDYLAFYRELYPQDPDPLFWIHVQIDFPFHVRGVFYFPKMHKGFDFQSNQLHLYCNRVFVADSCKDLLPDYLMVLKGAMDSPDIPLNVSRSYLQMDKTVRSLGQHIAKKITQKLQTMHAKEKEKFLEIWPEIEMVIKLGILQETSLYDKAKNFLLWQTLDGTWVSLEEIRSQGKKTVYYTTKDAQDLGISSLYKEKGIDVLLIHPVIDNPLMQRLEETLGLTFRRTDAALEEAFLDASREKTLLDDSGRSGAALIADFIASSLDEKDLRVEAKSLASEKVPALFVIDEENRRLKEFLMTHGKGDSLPQLPQKNTFVVNTNHPIITKAFALKKTQPKLAKKMISYLYDLTRLSHKELTRKDWGAHIAKSQEMLEDMMQQIP